MAETSSTVFKPTDAHSLLSDYYDRSPRSMGALMDVCGVILGATSGGPLTPAAAYGRSSIEVVADELAGNARRYAGSLPLLDAKAEIVNFHLINNLGAELPNERQQG